MKTDPIETKKAIVLAYLRMRDNRRRWRESLKKSKSAFLKQSLELLYRDSDNCLEHLKRVLWHNDWS